MSEKVIELKSIAKKYCFSSAKQSLISTFLFFFKKVKNKIEVWALKDINFSVKKGEIIGIIGENASGKTTILRIISGITVPSSGKVVVKGKVAGLLDLGAGFHPELTGRENIYLDAALYGLNKQDTDVVFEEILKFSGLEAAIDSQVKTYSQGMLVRLGFSVSVHVKPDIFLIDDSLAVGDEEFQRKCLARISAMNKQGTTVVIVSHDLDSLSRIANRGILLKNGQMVKDDSIDKSILRYVQAVGEKNSIACIDQGQLSVIFNNGKIVLLWDGKPITCDFGGYLSVKVLDKWLMSWQANWQMVKTEKDSFLMQGKWPNSGLNAEFQVKARSESEFECIGKINFGNNLKADKAVFGFMFNHKYIQYLDGNRLKQIQDQENSADRQWQDLYRTDQRDALLVLGASDQAPAVWASFEIDDLNGFGLIQTKGKSFEASVIQMQVLLAEELNVSCKTVIQLLNKKELEQKLKEEQEKVSISKHNLSIKLEQKCAHFFIGQQQITKAAGIRFGFEYQNHLYNLFDGQWKIRKNSSSEFLINSQFTAQGLSAELNLSLTDNELLIRLNLDNQQGEKREISSIQINADLIDEYNSYFSLDQESNFLAATEFDEKIILKEPNCGFIGFNHQGRDHCGIVFKTNDSGQINLYNSRREIGARRVQIISDDSGLINLDIIIIKQPLEKQKILLNLRERFNAENLLANDILRIDCSQDKIKLFLGSFEITALSGFISEVFINKRWYELHGVVKKIEKKDNFLFITIQRKFPDITEYWELELSQQSINWNVYLAIPEQISDFEYKIGIMLNLEFLQWINAYEKGSFLKNAAEMQKVELEELNSRLLGVSADDPSYCVLFENNSLADEQSYMPLLQESPQARVLNFLIKIVTKDWENKKKIVFSGKIKMINQKLWQKEIEEYVKQEFSIIPSDNYQLIAMQHKTAFFYLDRLISAGCGLGISFSAYDEFDSSRGYWQIKKEDKNTLNIHITYNIPQFAQNWYFRVKDGYVFWKVELEVFEQAVISSFTVNMFLPKVLNHWLTEQEQGIIAINPRNQEFKPINLIDNRSRYIVFKQEDQADNQSAAIAFAPFVDMQQWLMHIYKPASKDIIVLGIKRLFSEQEFLFKPGKYELFKANLEFFCPEKGANSFNQNIIQATVLPVNSLTKGKLKVVLEKAKIRLFHEGKELTRGLCLYTGIKLEEQWYDSSQAMCQIADGIDKIEAKFYLKNLKCAQTQKIEFINDKQILWQIDFVLNNESFEQITAGIMLSKEFTVWQTADDKQRTGKFSEQNKFNAWQQIAVSKNPIAVRGDQLPWVSWESVCSIDCDNMIEDSDKEHNSRMLGCKTKNITQQDNKISFIIKIKIDDQV